MCDICILLSMPCVSQHPDGVGVRYLNSSNGGIQSVYSGVYNLSEVSVRQEVLVPIITMCVGWIELIEGPNV